MSIAQGFEIRRIVVAIDSSADAADALETAATLAGHWHAELAGIFVEDINLVHLADLPVGREIAFPTGRGREYTAATLRTQNREQEFSARRAIVAAAARARIKHDFRVVRGRVDVEVINASRDGDLLILGTGRGSPGRVGRLGSTARAAAERAPHSVLVSKAGTRSIGAPLVCYDGSDGARQALEAGLALLSTPENSLTVLIVAPTLTDAAALRRDVEDRIATLSVSLEFLHSPHPTPDQMCRHATESGADILVLGADINLIADTDPLKILEAMTCPVLLVR